MKTQAQTQPSADLYGDGVMAKVIEVRPINHENVSQYSQAEVLGSVYYDVKRFNGKKKAEDPEMLR